MFFYPFLGLVYCMCEKFQGSTRVTTLKGDGLLTIAKEISVGLTITVSRDNDDSICITSLVIRNSVDNSNVRKVLHIFVGCNDYKKSNLF